jgi:hypothetical protein
MLEQSIDRLSGLIEQLIHQLELGRGGSQPVEVPQSVPTQPPTKAEKSTSSTGTTKSTGGAASAPAASGESTGLDYMADIAPRFQVLVQKDRPAAVALIAKLKPGAKKLTEAIEGHDLADVLAQINALIPTTGD